MSFIVLGPCGDGPGGDQPLRENKSDMVDGRFGGQRKTASVSDAKDYTKRTGSASNTKENPIDEAIKDIDDFSETKKGNASDFITASDSDRRPRMDEGSDGVQKPEASNLKQGKRENKWHFDSSNKYEGEMR